MSVYKLRGAVDGPEVQEQWPGRYCDICRARDVRPPELATHMRDESGGGCTFSCDAHFEELLRRVE